MPLKLNQDELPTINLTSMIDVLFLLIIFFMVGTRFTEEESNIKINLAKVAPNGAMLQGPPSKIVYVAADGSIQYENQRVTPDQLASLLSQAVSNYPETSVQLKPDAKVEYQPLSSVLIAIQQSGVRFHGLGNATYQMPTTRR
jgi:biopolymer transport protein ExbD